MNVRIGVDLVLISRIADLMVKEAWMNRVYTDAERQLAQSMSHHRRAEFLAGRFAVKEAVAKAAGTGIGAKLGLRDIETLRAPHGDPVVQFSDRFNRFLSSELGLQPKCEVSISHSEGENGGMGYAIAMVLLS